MKKRIIALLLCLSILMSLFTGSVVANGDDYSANVGKYAELADPEFYVPVANFTEITTEDYEMLSYEDFEPDTIFEIFDWYVDEATKSLWYQVRIYSGGVIPEAQKYWPAIPWIMQDYIGTDEPANTLRFLDTCDICGKPDCDGCAEEEEDPSKIYVDGEALEGELGMPKYDKPVLSAASSASEEEESYRWQILADEEEDLWVNIYGQTERTLKLSYGMVASLLNEDDQAQVRCIIGSDDDEVITDPVCVTVVPYEAPAVFSVREPEPTEEVTEPTEVVTEPTEAVTEPTEAVTEPTEAVTEPTEVVTEPTEVVTEPTEAVTEPTEAVTEPTEVVTEPTEAVTEPTEVVTEPIEIITESTETPTEPALVISEEPTEASTEEIQAAVQTLSLEERIPSSASAVPVDDNDSSIYTVTVKYVFFDSNTPAQETASVNVGTNGVMASPIQFPTLLGYQAYMEDEHGELQPASSYYSDKVTANIEVIVYYKPSDVNYTVEIYHQNIDDDEYTKVATKTYTAKTGSLVPQFAELPENDDRRIVYEGFYPLLNEMPTVAADGSTVVQLRFDRYYYLMKFDLDGGYGVNAFYARYDAPIGIVNDPEKAGATFQGWQLDGEDATIATKMPAKNLTYTAMWLWNTTSYTVVYWRENADDNGYSVWGSRIVQNVTPESGVTATSHSSLNNVTLDDESYFTYNSAKTVAEEALRKDLNADSKVVVAPDGSTVLNVYFSRNYYTIYFKGYGTCAITPHTHGTNCNKPLLCAIDHAHSDACIKDLTCAIDEHFAHNTSCLQCNKNEHTHGMSCLSCGQEAHSHSTACCTLEIHQHDITCYGPSNGYTTAKSQTGFSTISAIQNPQAGYIYKYCQSGRYGNTYYNYFFDGTTWYYLGTGTNYCGLLNGNISNPSNGNYTVSRYAKALGCNKTAHDHTTGCQTCSKTEHTHSESCYSCGKEEHIHDNTCFKDALHSHSESCYTYVCGASAHTHTDNCYGSCLLTAHTHSANSCNTSTTSNNTIYVLTAKYEQDISDLWPTYEKLDVDGYAYKNNSGNVTNTSGQRFRGWDIPTASAEAVSKRVTMTADLCDSSGSQDATAVYIASYKYHLHYMFESFDQDESNPDNGTTRRELDGVFYDSDPEYEQVLYYSSNNTTFGQKAITGMTAVTVKAENRTENGESVRYNFLYYKRERFNLSFFNVNKNAYTLTNVMYGAPFSGLMIDGKPASEYEPPYPDDHEPGAFQFEGWYTDPKCYDGTEVDWVNGTMPAANTEIYAKWGPVTHTVTVYLDLGDYQDKEVTDIYQFKHGELVPESQRPPVPENGGYTFIGWFYRDENDKEQYFDFANMPVTEGMHLYAKWSSNVLKEYTINFVLENGTPIGAPIKGSALAGTTKTFEAMGSANLYPGYQEGYFPRVKSHSIVLDIDDDSKNVFSFVYEYRQEPVPYTVLYLTKDENGNTVELGRKVVSDNRKAVVVENYQMFSGYMPNNNEFQKTLIVSLTDPEKNFIEFWYTPDTIHAIYTFNYYLQDIPAEDGAATTWSLSSRHSYGNIVEILSNEEKTFTIPEIDIEGFYLDKSVEDTRVTGTLSAAGDTLELKLYYKRMKYPYQIQYQEYGTGKEMSPTISFTEEEDRAYYGDYISVTTEQIPFKDGYKTHSVVGRIIDVAEKPTQNVVYVYYTPKIGNLQITKQISIINNNAPVPENQEFEFLVAVPEGVTGTYPVTIGENTENVTVTNGALKVFLKDGESATIQDLPQGPSTNKHQYTITETPVPGFNSSFSPAGAVTLSDGVTTTVTCTNEYPVGDLTITKKVGKEYSADQWSGGSFNFIITSNDLRQSDKPYKVMVGDTERSVWVSDHTITLNGVSVSSENPEVTIRIENVPAGSYTVAEKETDALKAAYTTTANRAAGYTATVDVTPSETPATVDFVNTFKRTTGDLYVSKTIEIVPDSGATLDPNAEFTFTVQMPSDVAADYFSGKTYTVKEHSTIANVTVGNDGKFTFVLKHGEHLIIEDLPVGSYVITEAPATGYASSFPIPNPVDGSVSETVAIATNVQSKLECINTYPVHVGNLRITKTVRNESGLATVPEDTFTFKVEFLVMGNNLTFPVTYSSTDTAQTLTAVRNGDSAVLTVELKDGESVLIEKLPEGVCTVTEVNIPVGYTAEAYDSSITIVPDQTQNLAVVNKYKPPTLTIEKTNAEAGQVFVYEIKDANGEIITVTVTGNSSTTIHNLVPGTYTVTQKNSWSWRYDDAAQTVTLPVEGTTVTFGGGIQNDSWLDGNSALVKNQRGG